MSPFTSSSISPYIKQFGRLLKIHKNYHWLYCQCKLYFPVSRSWCNAFQQLSPEPLVLISNIFIIMSLKWEQVISNIIHSGKYPQSTCRIECSCSADLLTHAVSGKKAVLLSHAQTPASTVHTHTTLHINSIRPSRIFHYMFRPYILTIFRWNAGAEGRVLQRRPVLYNRCKIH